MVEIADIKDERTLEAWLNTQPREVAPWTASRAAARVLPVLSTYLQTNAALRDENFTALPFLRCLLISTTTPILHTSEMRSAAFHAAKALDRLPWTKVVRPDAFAAAASISNATKAALSDPEHNADTRAALKAADAIADAKTRTAKSKKEAAIAFDAADTASWHAIKVDAAYAHDATLLAPLPLWPEDGILFQEDWDDTKKGVAAHDPDGNWQFWIDWYDALLSGRTMLPDPERTWNMLEQIALIDPKTWDAGPETVNPIIREIWKLHHLRSEVAALQAEKEAFLATRASTAQRSHNHPPEGLVDDQPELARQITIVWDSLDEARDALDQDTPDKGWLRAIAERLLSALTAIGQYCAKVADAAVMSAAKVGGGVGATGLIDHLANNGRLMQFAKDLFTFGAGG